MSDTYSADPYAQFINPAPAPVASPTVTPDIGSRIIGAESGGNPNARNPNSSGGGLGQFIDSTWMDMVNKYRPDLASGKSKDDILALKTDPALSKSMTNAYAAENSVKLSNAGLDTNPGNVYLSHFAGPQGAIDVLKADPNTPVSKILSPQAIAANPQIANMTAAQLQSWANGKVGQPEGYYGGRMHVTVPAGQPAQDPYAQFTGGGASQSNGFLPAAIADIPGEIKNAAGENIDAIRNMYGGTADKGVVQQTIDVGKGALAVGGLLASPITGTVRSLIGHPMADVEHAVGSVIAPDIAAKDNPQEMYQTAKGNVDTAMAAMRAGRPALVTAAPPVPPSGPLGVTLSRGQQTGDIALIRREQSALRGQLGPVAQQRATAFAQQQGGQVAAATDRVAGAFDQFGQTVAESPHDAGAVVQRGIQKAAADTKTAVNAKYTAARAHGGEVDASAFHGMGNQIRRDLTTRQDPVIIDDKLTPWASRALEEVDKTARFNIPNEASPGLPVDPSKVTGVSLEGIEQARKRLVTLRRGAWSNNESDGRAASAVLDAFDSHVTDAINSGAFRGDPAAVQAWNEARAAHADYRQKFSAVKNDPIGRQVEKIIGRRGQEPLTPNDVADALYGKSGTNPGTTNVGVANRIKKILGESSPEWSAVKQGLFSRLVERGEGETQMGPGMIANRMYKFLNSDGREMANAVFSPQERQMLGQLADLHRAMEIPKTGANYSETSTFVAPMLHRIATALTYLAGGAIAHKMGFGAFGDIVGGYITGKASNIAQNVMNARTITRQMPSVTEAMEKWQKAMAAFNKANSPPSKVALSVATTNLARSLKPLGIGLSDLFRGGAVPANADQNQQQ